MDRRTVERTGEWKDGQTNRWMDRWMDRQIQRQKVIRFSQECKDEWTNEQME
jgi:hypothetical protein